MFSKLFAVIAIVAVASNAQVPGVTPCILGCVGPAATDAGCGNITNTTCICTSKPFQDASAACIQKTCPNDVQAALDLQKSQCGASTPSGSVTPSGSATASGSGTSSPASSKPSGSSGGAASSTGTAPPSSSSNSAGSVMEASVAGIIGAILAGALAL